MRRIIVLLVLVFLLTASASAEDETGIDTDVLEDGLSAQAGELMPDVSPA